MTGGWIGVLIATFVLLVVIVYSLQVAFRGLGRRHEGAAQDTATTAARGADDAAERRAA